VRFLESGRELETPLDTRSVHLEEGKTHDHDDNTSDEREYTFPNLLGIGPEISNRSVKLSLVKLQYRSITYHGDKGGSNTDSDEESGNGTGPNLDPHALDDSLAIVEISLFLVWRSFMLAGSIG